jgi:hypothetical protein
VVDGVLALPRADSALELHYDLLTGEKEAGSRYRVSLLGGEGGIGTWEPLESHAFARLPAGRQRVRIEARDFAGVPAEPLELVVDVPQVWWQTPLARALQVLGRSRCSGACSSCANASCDCANCSCATWCATAPTSCRPATPNCVAPTTNCAGCPTPIR